VSTAVVTGAGRGIGRAIAIALAERGLDVALWGRTASDLEATAAEVAKRGVRALPLSCDVARSSDVQRASEATLAALGTPTLVVNNAGNVHRGPVVSMAEEDWDRVIDVNLKGTFLVTRAFLPRMLEAKRGRLVAIASISATLGTPNLSSYCAAKWGVVGFTKALAEELRGTGLTTLAVLPGSVDTDMLTGSGFAPQMSAADVARTVLYAGLDAPPAMNGSAIEMFG